jgi:cytochrome c-type biogenesis protein CcmH
MRIILIFLLMVQVMTVLAAGELLSFASEEEKKRFVTLTQEIRCVVCQGQSIADSNAPLAHDLRQKVYAKLHSGMNEAEIKRYLVERYGDSILFSPPLAIRTVILWLLPFVLLAAAGVWFLLYRAD